MNLVEKYLGEATLTRKHFIALAELMKRAKTLDHLKSDIIQWLTAHNPNFDEELFRQAAGTYIPPKSKEGKRR